MAVHVRVYGAPRSTMPGCMWARGFLSTPHQVEGWCYSSLDNPWWSERFRKAVRLYFPARESID